MEQPRSKSPELSTPPINRRLHATVITIAFLLTSSTKPPELQNHPFEIKLDRDTIGPIEMIQYTQKTEAGYSKFVPVRQTINRTIDNSNVRLAVFQFSKHDLVALPWDILNHYKKEFEATKAPIVLKLDFDDYSRTCRLVFITGKPLLSCDPRPAKKERLPFNQRDEINTVSLITQFTSTIRSKSFVTTPQLFHLLA